MQRCKPAMPVWLKPNYGCANPGCAAGRYTENSVSTATEAEIINGIIDPTHAALRRFIQETAPQGFVGAAAKLR
jgi:hypothetical protein